MEDHFQALTGPLADLSLKRGHKRRKLLNIQLIILIQISLPELLNRELLLVPRGPRGVRVGVLRIHGEDFCPPFSDLGSVKAGKLPQVSAAGTIARPGPKRLTASSSRSPQVVAKAQQHSTISTISS